MSAPSTPGGRRVVAALFRAFAREARRLTRARETLRLCAPLELTEIVRGYGRGSVQPLLTAPAAAAALQARVLPAAVLPLLRELHLDAREELSGLDVLRLARRGFRVPPRLPDAPASLPAPAPAASFAGTFVPPPPPPAVADAGLDVALEALQRLGQARAAAARSSSTTTSHARGTAVRVDVTTAAVPGVPLSVQQAAESFSFAYRVEVRNVGNKVVQLQARHWVFTDAAGRTIEVPRGSLGVVGHSPVLEPGQCFAYVSGVELRSERGSMRGSLRFLVPASDEVFEAAVAETPLLQSAAVLT